MDRSISGTTRLTLVRHGTTLWMEQGIMHGRLDSPLSKQGIKEAQSAANRLKGREFDVFYSSPVGRAMQTAALIGNAIDMEPTPLDGLMEQHFGSSEGTLSTFMPGRIQYVQRLILGWFIPPWKGGETFSETHNRVKKTYKEIIGRHQGRNILIVTHHGVINVILRLVSRRFFSFYKIAPAMIIEIEMDGNGDGKIFTKVPIS